MKFLIKIFPLSQPKEEMVFVNHSFDDSLIEQV